MHHYESIIHLFYCEWRLPGLVGPGTESVQRKRCTIYKQHEIFITKKAFQTVCENNL